MLDHLIDAQPYYLVAVIALQQLEEFLLHEAELGQIADWMANCNQWRVVHALLLAYPENEVQVQHCQSLQDLDPFWAFSSYESEDQLHILEGGWDISG